MKTIIFMPHATPDERIEALNKVCYNRGDDTFMRTLTESEIAVEKDRFVDLFKEEQVLVDEAKESAAAFAKKIKAASEERKEVFELINTRQREVRDKLYWVIDADNGNMNFFDRYGELIKSRKLTPDETNGILFNNDGSNANTQDVKEIPFIVEEPDHVADVADISDIQDADFKEVKDENVADGSIVDENATETDAENTTATQEDGKPTETGQKSKKPRKPKQTPEKE